MIIFRGITRTANGFAVYFDATAAFGSAYGGIKFINIEADDSAEGFPVEMGVNIGYNNKFKHFYIDLEVNSYNLLVDTMQDETEFFGVCKNFQSFS